MIKVISLLVVVSICFGFIGFSGVLNAWEGTFSKLTTVTNAVSGLLGIDNSLRIDHTTFDVNNTYVSHPNINPDDDWTIKKMCEYLLGIQYTDHIISGRVENISFDFDEVYERMYRIEFKVPFGDNSHFWCSAPAVRFKKGTKDFIYIDPLNTSFKFIGNKQGLSLGYPFYYDNRLNDAIQTPLLFIKLGVAQLSTFDIESYSYYDITDIRYYYCDFYETEDEILEYFNGNKAFYTYLELKEN